MRDITRDVVNLGGRVSALLRYYNLIVALWDGEGWHRFAPLRRSAGPVAPGRAEKKLHVCRAGGGGEGGARSAVTQSEEIYQIQRPGGRTGARWRGRHPTHSGTARRVGLSK